MKCGCRRCRPARGVQCCISSVQSKMLNQRCNPAVQVWQRLESGAVLCGSVPGMEGPGHSVLVGAGGRTAGGAPPCRVIPVTCTH